MTRGCATAAAAWPGGDRLACTHVHTHAATHTHAHAHTYTHAWLSPATYRPSSPSPQASAEVRALNGVRLCARTAHAGGPAARPAPDARRGRLLGLVPAVLARHSVRALQLPSAPSRRADAKRGRRERPLRGRALVARSRRAVAGMGGEQTADPRHLWLPLALPPSTAAPPSFMFQAHRATLSFPSRAHRTTLLATNCSDSLSPPPRSPVAKIRSRGRGGLRAGGLEQSSVRLCRSSCGVLGHVDQWSRPSARPGPPDGPHSRRRATARGGEAESSDVLWPRVRGLRAAAVGGGTGASAPLHSARDCRRGGPRRHAVHWSAGGHLGSPSRERRGLLACPHPGPCTAARQPSR